MPEQRPVREPVALAHLDQSTVDRADAGEGVGIDRKEHAQDDQKQPRLFTDSEPQYHQREQRKVWNGADHLHRSIQQSLAQRVDSGEQPQDKSDTAPMAKPLSARAELIARSRSSSPL